MSKESKFITSKQVADKLGFSPDYIRSLCANGTLKAEKFGKTWVIDARELKKIKRQRYAKENADDTRSAE